MAKPPTKRIIEVREEHYPAPITTYQCTRYIAVFDDGTEYSYDIGCDPNGKKPSWMKVGMCYNIT